MIVVVRKLIRQLQTKIYMYGSNTPKAAGPLILASTGALVQNDVLQILGLSIMTLSLVTFLFLYRKELKNR
jgi:hypothetical protein